MMRLPAGKTIGKASRQVDIVDKIEGGKAQMKEKEIEQYLVRKVKLLGGKAFKWVSPGNNGVPDRIVLFPGRWQWYVELKAPGAKPTVMQLARHRELAAMGWEVKVLDSLAGVDAFLAECRAIVKGYRP